MERVGQLGKSRPQPRLVYHAMPRRQGSEINWNQPTSATIPSHRRDCFFFFTACAQAVSRALLSSAALSLDKVAVVQPCLPHAFGTGANASGAIMHLNSCSSGVKLKFAVCPSAASVT